MWLRVAACSLASWMLVAQTPQAATWLERAKGLEGPDLVECLEQGCANLEQSLPPGHVERSILRKELGWAYLDLNRATEAEACFRAALNPLPTDPKIEAELRNGLGAALRELRRWAESSTELERALALRKEAFGAASEPVANTLRNLGRLAWARPDSTVKASTVFLQELALRTKLGADEEDRLDSLDLVAQALVREGSIQASIPYRRQVLELAQRLHPTDTLNHAVRAWRLGTDLLNGNAEDQDQAARYHRAYAEAIVRDPRNHAWDEGGGRASAWQFNRGLDDFGALPPAQQHLLGSVHALDSLALAHAAAHRYLDAVAFARQAQGLALATFGPRHPAVVLETLLLAFLLEQVPLPKEAGELRARVAPVLKAQPRLAYHAAELLPVRQPSPEAERLLALAHGSRSGVADPPPEIARAYATILERNGKAAAARKVRPAEQP